MIRHGVVAAPDSVKAVYDVTSVTLAPHGMKTNRVTKNDFYQAVKALTLAIVAHLKLENMNVGQGVTGFQL